MEKLQYVSRDTIDIRLPDETTVRVTKIYDDTTGVLLCYAMPVDAKWVCRMLNGCARMLREEGVVNATLGIVDICQVVPLVESLTSEHNAMRKQCERLFNDSMAPKYPDIGLDPLKHPGEDYTRETTMAKSMERLRSGVTIQQPYVPDQTALVWRADLDRLLVDHTWRSQHLPLIHVLEGQLGAAQSRASVLETELEAWQRSFGTSQLSHALARCDMSGPLAKASELYQAIVSKDASDDMVQLGLLAVGLITQLRDKDLAAIAK